MEGCNCTRCTRSNDSPDIWMTTHPSLLDGEKIEWPLRASKKCACLTKLGKIASRNGFSKDSMWKKDSFFNCKQRMETYLINLFTLTEWSFHFKDHGIIAFHAQYKEEFLTHCFCKMFVHSMENCFIFGLECLSPDNWFPNKFSLSWWPLW